MGWFEQVKLVYTCYTDLSVMDLITSKHTNGKNKIVV